MATLRDRLFPREAPREPAGERLAPPQYSEPIAEPHPGPHTRRPIRGADRDLTTGSIPKNLFSLAWPQVIESILNVADQMADIIWAGRLGTRSVAGLGVSQTFVMTASSGRMGLDMGMRAMIARAVGAGDIGRANHVALQAFTLSGAFAVLMA